MNCPSCNATFVPRRSGGRPQRFCSLGCRRAHEAAARAAGRAQIEGGVLPTRALPQHCLITGRAPDIAPPDPALLAALRVRGQMVLPPIPIAPEGIAALVTGGWLDRRRCRDPAAVADALVDLANAALGLA